jgi:uncharacterized membrane protein YbhN (UPF0104 family)
MRRLLSLAVKAAISALLLYLSLRRVDLTSVGQRLAGLELSWIALALLVLCVQVALGALRWREVALICGSRLQWAQALRYSFIGQFFSQVLPSTIGGDAVRIWLMARGGAGWSVATYSVLIDRVVGVTVLAALVIACLPWTLDTVHDPVARAALALIGAGMLGGSAVFLALRVQHLQAIKRWWLTRHLAAASGLAWRLCQSITGARVAALSFAIHLLTVTVAWAAAMAVRAPVEFAQLLFLVLPVILISTIPVSIAGWGVRESAMVLAFSYAGLPENDGLIVSILYGVTTLSVGAVGGIVWVASGYQWRSIKIMEADTLAHDPSA